MNKHHQLMIQAEKFILESEKRDVVLSDRFSAMYSLFVVYNLLAKKANFPDTETNFPTALGESGYVPTQNWPYSLQEMIEELVSFHDELKEERWERFIENHPDVFSQA